MTLEKVVLSWYGRFGMICGALIVCVSLDRSIVCFEDDDDCARSSLRSGALVFCWMRVHRSLITSRNFFNLAIMRFPGRRSSPSNWKDCQISQRQLNGFVNNGKGNDG